MSDLARPDLAAACPPKPDRILRRREVEHRVGLSRSAIYRRLARREFPAPIDLGGGCVGWRESTIAAWIATRPEHFPS